MSCKIGITASTDLPRRATIAPTFSIISGFFTFLLYLLFRRSNQYLRFTILYPASCIQHPVSRAQRAFIQHRERSDLSSSILPHFPTQYRFLSPRIKIFPLTIAGVQTEPSPNFGSLTNENSLSALKICMIPCLSIA